MLSVKSLKWIVLVLSCSWFVPAVSAGQEGEFEAKGKYVRLDTANDNNFAVYLVGPEKAKRALLLIHGWWGLNTEIERWADEFATDGYRVMAVDLFNGNVTAYPPTARKLISAVHQNEANEKYAAALKALSAPGRKIAVMGRSYGASQALHAATLGRSNVSATVIYYPYGETIKDSNAMAAINSPILAHFARTDRYFPLDKVIELTSTMHEAGGKMTVNLYDAKHGFDKRTGKNFDEAAHKLSFSRTQLFLDQHMRE